MSLKTGKTSGRFPRARLFAAALALAAVAFVLAHRTPRPASPQSGEVPAPGESPGASAPAAGGIQTPVSPSPQLRMAPPRAQLSQLALREISRCLGAAGSKSPSPGTLGEALDAIRDGSAPEVRYRNWHVKLPDGSMRRLQILADTGRDGQNLTTMRWFAEDGEKLPVPIKLPLEHRKNPPKSVIEAYLSRGELTLDEQALEAAAKPEHGGGKVEWTQENGQIDGLEWNGPHGHLACEADGEISCQCSAAPPRE